MIDILGYELTLPAGLDFLSQPLPVFLINTAAWIVLAYLALMRVFKFVTRRLSSELADIMLGIFSRPIVFLVALYGIVFSFRQLPLLPVVQGWIETLSITIVVGLVTHILGRFIRDVLVYYGEKWAARTETRVDDILVPILNLFGPLLLVIAAGLIVLPMWGVNVTSVLLGAGVIGLVLGLALQDTLGNIFSGLSLLIEGPFRKGDLILLSDGRVSEVVHLGIRSTMLFSLDEQATIYVPNKTLAASQLINLTMPTPEQRHCIDVKVGRRFNLAQVQDSLFRIANGHPAVLSSEMAPKLVNVREQAAEIRRQAERLLEGDPAARNLLAEAERNEATLVKLELDGCLNDQIQAFKESLRSLVRAINAREVQGLSEGERQELYCNFVSPAENGVRATMERAREWVEARDPWVNDTDYWNEQKVWAKRNEQLLLHWERLKKALYEVDTRHEMRLDDITKLMLGWLEKEYKVPPGYWKNPTVAIQALDGPQTLLRICYYVDNIRLEHDGRAQRVRTELSRMIHEKMTEDGMWG